MKEVLIKDLQFAYPDKPERKILEDINLTIAPGEFVCLLGQSGCGKSTFLRLLAGLEKPSAGAIEIDGKAITGAGLDRGVVFQDYGLFPWMTAGENIVLALKKKYKEKSKKELKEFAIERLESVGLKAEVYDMLPKNLSGGMKQRCAIATAFGIDSPVLLMDEPFGALDAVTRAKLQDMVLELWAKEETKKNVFFVTHDVDEALLLATRIIVFGQSPSHVIYDCQIPEEHKPTRESQFDDPDVLKLRNTLIKYINGDITSHIQENENSAAEEVADE